METWVDRLIIERDDLKLKIEKLHKFLDSGEAPDDEEAILYDQFEVMNDYLNILNTRLGRNVKSIIMRVKRTSE